MPIIPEDDTDDGGLTAVRSIEFQRISGLEEAEAPHSERHKSDESNSEVDFIST